MNWRPEIRARVLIVENEELDLVGKREDLHSINPYQLHAVGLEKFDIRLARALDEAEEELSKTGSQPYDLMLLDLAIPVTQSQPMTERPENGERLLGLANQRVAVKGIIVTSVFADVERIGRLFRQGVIDFINKPHSTAQLQNRVIECWKTIMWRESLVLLGEERIRDLVHYAERSLAHGFHRCFANYVREIADSSEDLEKLMSDRYGLDREKDAEDRFFAHLKAFRESSERARKSWSALQSPFNGDDEPVRAENLTVILEEVFQSLSPALVVKGVTVEGRDDTAVDILSFGDAVKAVIMEIVRGGIATLADSGTQSQRIEFKIEREIGQVKLTFRDQFATISGESAKEINKGELTPRLSLWFQHACNIERAWGLSVMQQIALRGGGRLEVRPHAKGNVITYFVPTA